MAPCHGSPERAVLADEVVLTDELVERARAHASGERLRLRWRSEERRPSGRGSVDRAPSWHRRQSTGQSPGGASDREDPGQLQGEQPEEDHDQDHGHDRDPAQVARHVGVLVGVADGEPATAAFSGHGPTILGLFRAATRPLASALGGILLSEDPGLEVGGPSLLVGGEAGLGRGFYLQMEGFENGRLQTAARAVGLMQAAFEAGVTSAGEQRGLGQSGVFVLYTH